MPDDTLPTVVAAMERAVVTNASVLRQQVYAALAASGVNVDALVTDARRSLIAEIEARPKKGSGVKGMIAKIKARLPAPSVRGADLVPRDAVAMPKGGMVATSERARSGWAIAQCQHVLSPEEFAAAERLRRAFSLSIGRSPVTFETASGQGYTPLIPVQHRSVAEWRAIWTRLDPVLRVIVWNFVAEQPPSGHDRPLSADEFGALYGQTKDKRRARGVTDGAIKTALAHVSDLWRQYDEWQAQQGRDMTPRPVSVDRARVAGPEPMTWLEDRRVFRGAPKNL